MSPRRPDPKPKRRVNQDGSVSWEIRPCPTCDRIGPVESPWQSDFTEMHRAMHDFGRVFMAEVAALLDGAFRRMP